MIRQLHIHYKIYYYYNMNNNILQITFDASTINGNIVKNMRYTPAMSQPQLYNSFSNILFIPTIKLTRAIFGKSMGLFDRDLGDNDIKKIFLSVSQMNNFLERIKEKNIYKKITLEDAKEKGITYNNIKFILGLFFKKGERFHIYQKSYIINNYNWNNKYDYDRSTLNYKIKIGIVLHEGSELTFIDSTRLGCLQRKNSIIADYYELVGLKKPILSKTAPIEKQPVFIPKPTAPAVPVNITNASISSASPVVAKPLSPSSPEKVSYYKGGKKNKTHNGRKYIGRRRKLSRRKRHY